MAGLLQCLSIALVALALACTSRDAFRGGPEPEPRSADEVGPRRVATVYAPHRLDPTRNPQLYAMTVAGTSEADVARRLAGARASGPGRPVPPGVLVDAWLELEGLARLRSSVTGRFASFRLEIGGTTVADLGVGLNAAVEAAGHGWSTLVVDLPPELALRGTPVVLVQRREGADSALELALDF